MDFGSSVYKKVYSQRALDTPSVSKKESGGSLTAAETSERMFALLRDILEETLERTDHQLEELVEMNLEISKMIVKCELLDRLKSTKQLKAVLFELIILIKEQCVGSDRADSLEMMELKMKYNSLRASYSDLRNTISQAKALVGQSGLLLGQFANQGSGVDTTPSRSRKARVENLQRQFENVKQKLTLFESGTSSPSPSTARKSSEDSHKNIIIDKLQDSLQARQLQLDTQRSELAIEKKKHDRTREQLQEQREQAASEIELLRRRLTELRQSTKSRQSPPVSSNQQDMLTFLVMQSLSLEQLIAHS